MKLQELNHFPQVGVMTRQVFFLSLAFVLSTVFVSFGAGQPAPQIGLDPAIDCWFDSEFPILGARVTPPEDIVRSRLYFRCSLYPDYYFVDLVNESGTFRGVAPQADQECPRVHYYVEALGRDYTSVRTEEKIADVASPNECRNRYPAAAWFPGGAQPGIVLGSVTGSGLAPGFQSVGIVGFMSSTGGTVAAVAGSGGISSGVVAGVAAAGGAAAGIGVLASGGGSSTTTSAPVAVPPPSTTTTTVPGTTTTPPAPQSVKACLAVDPSSGIAGVGDPITFDGRCSSGVGLTFRYDLGDGRFKEGQAFITAVWSVPGIYEVKLTVSSNASPLSVMPVAAAEDSVTKQITILRPVSAQFAARALLPGPCTGEFDGTPSTGDISRYEWELDPNNELGFGAIRVRGPIVSQDWKSNCFETDGFVLARLTVFGRDGSSDTVERRVKILSRVSDERPARSDVESSFSSEMLESGEARGQVVLEGGRSHPVSGEARALVRYAGRPGRNVVEAVLSSEAPSPVLWRFDFSGARGFVPGSLRALSGQEVGKDAYSIVLRLSGSPGERVRFEYELER